MVTPGCKGHVAIGRTLNISRSGVLVVWERFQLFPEIPSLGTTLKLDLELPPNRYGRRYLRCAGRIVRVHAAQGRNPHIAVSIEQIEFRGDVRKPLEKVRANRAVIEELLM